MTQRFNHSFNSAIINGHIFLVKHPITKITKLIIFRARMQERYSSQGKYHKVIKLVLQVRGNNRHKIPLVNKEMISCWNGAISAVTLLLSIDIITPFWEKPSYPVPMQYSNMI
jgi:hypothetical protein